MFEAKLGVVRERRRKHPALNLYNRIIHKYFVHDLSSELQVRARQDTADYVQQAMQGALMFDDHWKLLLAALSEVPALGLCLEFGVARGDTVNFCARYLAETGREMHGFDSFEGLPEPWTGTTEPRGAFNLGGKLPRVLPNVRLHKGWFNETVPAFLATSNGPVAFMHIDCDIYSSTKCVLDATADRLQPGAIVAFDEYFNYFGWRQHEFRAWQEIVRERNLRYEYRGFCGRGKQVYIKLL